MGGEGPPRLALGAATARVIEEAILNARAAELAIQHGANYTVFGEPPPTTTTTTTTTTSSTGAPGSGNARTPQRNARAAAAFSSSSLPSWSAIQQRPLLALRKAAAQAQAARDTHARLERGECAAPPSVFGVDNDDDNDNDAVDHQGRARARGVGDLTRWPATPATPAAIGSGSGRPVAFSPGWIAAAHLQPRANAADGHSASAASAMSTLLAPPPRAGRDALAQRRDAGGGGHGGGGDAEAAAAYFASATAAAAASARSQASGAASSRTASDSASGSTRPSSQSSRCSDDDKVDDDEADVDEAADDDEDDEHLDKASQSNAPPSGASSARSAHSSSTTLSPPPVPMSQPSPSVSSPSARPRSTSSDRNDQTGGSGGDSDNANARCVRDEQDGAPSIVAEATATATTDGLRSSASTLRLLSHFHDTRRAHTVRRCTISLYLSLCLFVELCVARVPPLNTQLGLCSSKHPPSCIAALACTRALSLSRHLAVISCRPSLFRAIVAAAAAAVQLSANRSTGALRRLEALSLSVDINAVSPSPPPSVSTLMSPTTVGTAGTAGIATTSIGAPSLLPRRHTLFIAPATTHMHSPGHGPRPAALGSSASASTPSSASLSASSSEPRRADGSLDVQAAASLAAAAKFLGQVHSAAVCAPKKPSAVHREKRAKRVQPCLASPICLDHQGRCSCPVLSCLVHALFGSIGFPAVCPPLAGGADTRLDARLGV